MISYLFISLLVMIRIIINKNTINENNLKHFQQKRNLQYSQIINTTELDATDEDESKDESSEYDIYYDYSIYILDYSFSSNQMIIQYYSLDQLPSNLLLSIYLYIQIGDQSGNEYYLNASLDTEEEMFIGYFENINFDDLNEYMRITILNITIDNTLQEGKSYYIDYEQLSFEFIQSTISISNSIYYQDQSDEIIINNSQGKTSSNSLSKGALIGIIIGLVALIVIIIIIIILIRRCKKQTDNTDTEVVVINDIEEIKDQKDKMRKFVLQTQDQTTTIVICIEIDKSMKDLRKLFFEKINQEGLINDKSIYFLCDGNAFYWDNEVLVKDFCIKCNKAYKVVIVDQESKIHYEEPNKNIENNKVEKKETVDGNNNNSTKDKIVIK